ncbi:MAG: DinB family protein, partial [Acidobacteria bacterium]|nr:DinB family protein [Acidobacteriota bacterium]
EDMVRPAGTSFSTLLGTLAHILGAERVWLSRFVGNPLPVLPTEEDYPDREALLMGFREFWPEFEFFLAALTEEQLRASFQWTNSRGETYQRLLWQAVLHLSNHSSYHRGQVVSLLRQLAYEPPATDLIYFWKDA